MMTDKMLKRLAVTGLTAAVYTVMNLLFPFLAYNEIQCRLSEMMNLLAFVNPVFAPGMILGCFITNMFSPLGPIDMVVGTFATAVTMFCVTRSKSLFAASIWPTVFCVFIGAEITFLAGPPYLASKFILSILSVMAGEFVAMTLIGYPVFKYLMKNERLMKILKGL